MELREIREMASAIRENVCRVIVGKQEQVDYLLIALMSGGHVLLEDVPGMGKTVLAKTLARSLDCDFKRVQLTPDLLPSDITGIHFYNQKAGEFVFRPGPVFTNILLADEINRATPRTQSALLECMEERQVSLDGTTHALAAPFMVLATQNPVETQGTFPLPEAQVDRFMMKLGMGYPDTAQGIQILERFREGNPMEALHAVATGADICAAQNALRHIPVHGDILAYIVALAEETRQHPDLALGASPRATQALLKAAQVRAVLQGRDFVIPDDVQQLARPVLAHRLIVRGAARLKSGSAEDILSQVMKKIPVPTEQLQVG